MKRRILPLSLLVLMLTGGVALADRDRNRGERDARWRDRGGPVLRGDRSPTRSYNRNLDRTARGYSRPVVRSGVRPVTRSVTRPLVRPYAGRHERTRPTFRDNRFYFSGGFTRSYSRPVINVRYRDYYQRPALIVENYQPVAGYLWIQGSWAWDGYEWIWVPGHYDVDPHYQPGYQPGYADPYGYGY